MTHLRTIFGKVIPPDQASWLERYCYLLAKQYLVSSVATADQLQQALEDIANVEPSLPDEQSTTIFSTGQGSNFNTSTGTQKVHQAFGTGTTIDVENYYASKADSLSPRNPTVEDKCILMPYELVFSYTPRPELSEELGAKLKAPYNGTTLLHAVIVTGLGGTGKTQLVLDFVKRHKAAYDTIIWLNASSEQSLRSSFAACCEELHLRPTRTSNPSRIEDEPSVRAAFNWFRGRKADHQKWLVVLDNADDASKCPYSVVPRGGAGTVIITSRDNRASRLVDGRGGTVQVDAMQLEEPTDLLLRSAGISVDVIQDTVREGARQIAQKLDALPLAVGLAGAAKSDELQELRLEDDVNDVLQRYLVDLRYHRDLLLTNTESEGLTHYDKTVWTVWDKSFAAIRRFRPKVFAIEVLTFLTYADRSFIQHDLFRLSALEYRSQTLLIGSLLPPWLKGMLHVRDQEWDDRIYRETIKPLVRHGFVRLADIPSGLKGLTLHGLVQWRASKQSDVQQYWEPYVAWTYLVSSHCARESKLHNFQRAAIAHLPGTKKLRDDFDLRDDLDLPDAPVLLCQVLRAFGYSWKSARRWQRAERLFLKGVQTAKSIGFTGDLKLMRVFRHEIADIQFQRKFRDEEAARSSDIKRRTQAAIFIEETFDIEAKEVGDEDAMTLSTGTNLACASAKVGKRKPRSCRPSSSKKAIPRGTSKLRIRRKDLYFPDEQELRRNDANFEDRLDSIKIPLKAYWSRLLLGNYSELYIAWREDGEDENYTCLHSDGDEHDVRENEPSPHLDLPPVSSSPVSSTEQATVVHEMQSSVARRSAGHLRVDHEIDPITDEDDEDSSTSRLKYKKRPTRR